MLLKALRHTCKRKTDLTWLMNYMSLFQVLRWWEQEDLKSASKVDKNVWKMGRGKAAPFSLLVAMNFNAMFTLSHFSIPALKNLEQA